MIKNILIWLNPQPPSQFYLLLIVVSVGKFFDCGVGLDVGDDEVDVSGRPSSGLYDHLVRSV